MAKLTTQQVKTAIEKMSAGDLVEIMLTLQYEFGRNDRPQSARAMKTAIRIAAEEHTEAMIEAHSVSS